MKPTIAFYDVPEADQPNYQAALGQDFELVMTNDGLTDDTVKLAADAEILSIHVTSKVTAQLMQHLPKLKHIACRSTGYDHVDLEYTRAHDITVSTVPSYGENTVAEYAFMLMLAVTRKLMLSAEAVHTGSIVPAHLTGFDLSGKTLGVIGTGRIGRHAITIARGFGMKVVGYDPFPNADAAKELGFEYKELAQLLSEADYITVHAPATADNHHVLNAEAFAKMKPGVFVINTARGGLIDTEALIDALGSGQVAGAGLDVLEGEEYMSYESELHLLHDKQPGDIRAALYIEVLEKMPNVLITSHNAYNSAEALGRIRQTSIDNIRKWHANSPQNLVK